MFLLLQACGGQSVSELHAAAGLPPLEGSTDSYYAGTAGKDGADLRTLLHDVIKGHEVHSYNDVQGILMESDRDPNNPDNVILFYTGESAKNGWNREHVWAKSHGFPSSSQPPYSDAHHLRPCNSKLNSTRGNLHFGTVEDGATLDDDGNKLGAKFFEPADDYKGDVARIIFYMDVRYDGDADKEPDLVVANDNLGTKKGKVTVARFGKLSDLLRWNQEDPVDDIERRRNETIYGYQNNRNPFIDHPEFASKIWGASH